MSRLPAIANNSKIEKKKPRAATSGEVGPGRLLGGGEGRGGEGRRGEERRGEGRGGEERGGEERGGKGKGGRQIDETTLSSLLIDHHT